MTDTRTIFTPQDADDLCKWLVGLPLPFTVTVQDGKKRTLNQNALLHKWYGEIAKQDGDKTAKEVKGECHQAYALDIRLRDAQFAWVWKHTGARMTYEQQCALLASETLAISSAMTTAELREYMDEMLHDYTVKGYRLTIPEEKSDAKE